jgi:glycosyltransferase involved in cell wall biosynthesis
MQEELVSVVIPTKDRNDLLNRAINSVLSQTYQNLEVIVVDDGSSSQLVIQADDPRIRVIRNEVSKGNAAARNRGMKIARGKYLCLLDDDDYYFPHKIAVQYKYLKDNPDVDVVFSDVPLLDEVAGKCLLPTKNYHSFDVRTNFLQMNRIHTNGSLFKSSVVETVSFNEKMTKFNDTYFYLAISLNFTVRYLPSIVAVWTFDHSRMDSRVSSATSAAVRERNYQSFALLCHTFEYYMASHAEVKSKYLEKLALLALEAKHPEEAWRWLIKANNRVPTLAFLKLLAAVKFPWLRRQRYRWVWRKHSISERELPNNRSGMLRTDPNPLTVR